MTEIILVFVFLGLILINHNICNVGNMLEEILKAIKETK